MIGHSGLFISIKNMHEMKLIVDLIYEGGLSRMRYSISDTAEYGDYTRGPRLITEETRKEMKRILKEIQDGSFAREFIVENMSGRAHFLSMRRMNANHPVEKVGAKLRDMISPLPYATTLKPGSASLPLPGIDAAIVDQDNKEVGPNQGGFLVVRKPWPGMLRGIWGAPERFKQQYFTGFKACYESGDGARRDEDGYFWIMAPISARPALAWT